MTATGNEALRRVRQRLGMSQTQLAKAAGMAQSAVSAYECGRVPSWPILVKLMSALEATPDELGYVVETKPMKVIRLRDNGA